MKNLILLGILLVAGNLSLAQTAAPATMAEIPAGEFIFGNQQFATASLPTFWIDLYETTNAEFAKIFSDHEYPLGADLHPATGMTWNEAAAFCQQTGKRLPTEAEWEKAARGTEGRLYPWGDRPLKGKPHPFISGLVKRRVGFQKKDVSPYGAQGMAGSVWEWTASKEGDNIIARGGLWNLHLDYEFSKTYEKILKNPDEGFSFLGFRCARSP